MVAGGKCLLKDKEDAVLMHKWSTWEPNSMPLTSGPAIVMTGRHISEGASAGKAWWSPTQVVIRVIVESRICTGAPPAVYHYYRLVKEPLAWQAKPGVFQACSYYKKVTQDPQECNLNMVPDPNTLPSLLRDKDWGGAQDAPEPSMLYVEQTNLAASSGGMSHYGGCHFGACLQAQQQSLGPGVMSPQAMPSASMTVILAKQLLCAFVASLQQKKGLKAM